MLLLILTILTSGCCCCGTDTPATTGPVIVENEDKTISKPVTNNIATSTKKSVTKPAKKITPKPKTIYGTLVFKNWNMVPVAVDNYAYDAMLSACGLETEEETTDELFALAALGLIYMEYTGTKVQVISSDEMRTYVKILSGPETGMKFVIANECIEYGD